MKNIFSILVTLLVTTSLWAYDFQSGKLCYNITSDSTVEVTYQSSDRPTSTDNYPGITAIDIPSSVTYNGITYSVTSIGNKAFSACNGLYNITIPNSITSIGNQAFCYCYYIESISIPNSVTSIGIQAFAFCSSLTSITIPASVTSIGKDAFGGCTFERKNFINNSNCTSDNNWGATIIEEEEPEEKYTITYTSTDGNIVTPRNANVFGANIISNTYENGVGTITFDGPVTSIGDGAFFYLKTLTSVTIPNSVMSIGKEAFSVCSALKSIIIPESVTSIGEQAFRYCFSLTSVTIPNSITSIRERTFEECTSLISITIPNSVTSIEDFVFYGCSSLTSVTIGNSVKSIGDNVFYETSIYNSESNWENGVLYIGNYLIRAKEDISGSYTIKESTQLIANYAFCWCSSLTSITIPNSVKSIGDGIFFESDSLSCIVVEGGNTTYDSRDNCNAIIETATNTLIVGCKNTIIPTTVTNIGNSAFAGCPLLTSITIPESVTSIGDLAFSKCYFMKSKFINHSNCTSEDNWGATILNYDIETDTVGWNVPAEALSVAQAREICAGLESGQSTDKAYYVKGYIKKLNFRNAESIPNYGTAQFYIEDVLCAYSSDDFIAYQVYGIDSTKLTDPNSVAVGDFVVIHGNLVNYNGTYETVGGGKSYIWKSTNPLLASSDNNNDNNDEDGVKDNQIKYTTSDGKVINVENYSFDANIVSNTYENGVGIITFDAPITKIRNLAFRECTTLTSIEIPNSVTEMEGGSFAKCSSLKSVKLSKNIQELPFYLNYDPGFDIFESYGFFEGCSSLESITIPDSVKTIGENAFKGCVNLATLSIPDDITYIDVNAFEGTPWYNKLPDGELYIGKVFYKFKGEMLENTAIKIKDGTIGITTHAFEGCSKLVSVIIPNSVTQIGGAIFSNCTSLKNVVLPTGLKSLGSYCTYYTTISPSLCRFDGFFSNCSSLTSVTLPHSIETIGENTFSSCTSLDTIFSYSQEPPTCLYEWYGTSEYCDAFYNTTIEKIFVHEKAVQLYKKEWSRVAEKIFPFPGEALFLTPITTKNITQTTASINAIITNADSAYAYNVGYISKEDTVYLEYSDTLEFTVANLYPNQSNQITLFVGKKDEPFDYYVFEQVNVQTKSISMNVQVPTTTQTTAKIILSYNAGDATPIERGIILTHPNGQIDSISFEINQTDTTIRELIPYSSYSVTGYCVVKEGYLKFTSTNTFKTKDIRVNVNVQVPIITQTTAKITLSCSTSDATPIEQGIILTHPNGQIDSIPFEINQTDTTIRELIPYSSYSVTGYCVVKEGYLKFTSTNTFKTKDIRVNVNVQVPIITQTTAKITLSCSASDATPIERGIILTHPNGQIDSIPFEINQTDTTIRELIPYSSYSVTGYCVVKEGYLKFTSTNTFKTKDIYVYIYTKSKTQTTLHIGLGYNAGDATITDKGLIVHCPNGKIDTISIKNTYEGITGDTLLTQLRINSEYDVYGFILTEEGGLKVGNGNAIYTNNIESTITSSNRTQTTVSLSASLGLGDATDYNKNGLQWTVGSSFNSYNYETIYFKEGVFDLDTTFTNLSPNTQYAFRLFHYSVNESGKEYCVYGDTRKFTTSSVVLYEPTLQTTGQTYIEVQTNNVYGDATLIEEVVEVATSRYSTPEQRVNVAGCSNVIINNLMPDTKYYFRSVLNTRETGILQSEWYEATTKQITLATGEADGISNTSAFLHGTIDCDTMSRTEIGFEWKRSDAPSTVKPQRLLVVDRVDENLIFRLEGLSRDRYYDFRTFCLYNGQEYYGEWVGFLTSDQDVLIPPSVQTLNAEITDLGVLMKGFVVAGTEVILQRGFECWREGSDQVATTVAEGAIMSSYIPEAWSYATYKYRAYAKTPAGTVYGETLEISTGYISTDIPDVTVNASSNSAQITWTFVEQADYYILTLYADENMTEVIGVYTVDKNGNITQKRVASSMPLLVTCNLIDLLPGTNYYFAVKAYNDEDQMVAEESGTFATSQISTSLENLNVPTNHSKKIIRNGQLIIVRDGVEYNAMGQEL